MYIPFRTVAILVLGLGAAPASADENSRSPTHIVELDGGATVDCKTGHYIEKIGGEDGIVLDLDLSKWPYPNLKNLARDACKKNGRTPGF